MSFQAIKPKSAAKIMMPTSANLDGIVLKTLEHMAEMAGSTLGPGGRQILIERPELGMKPIVTKDGVTVIKHLGYSDSIQQLILEAARDAAGRTAVEAGDGTTTATILSAAIARHVNNIVKTNSKVSPQKIVRELQAMIPLIEKKIRSYTIDASSEEILLNVAALSANGDKDLASAVIEAFNVVGDEGNMTIVDQIGNSKYKVERIHGYTVETGHEESCRSFANGFLNDSSGTTVKMDKPIFVLYDGIINDVMQIHTGMNKIALANKGKDTNVVLMAHGFSDSFIGEMHFNWNNDRSEIKIYPLLTEQNGLKNHATQLLYDLQAYTGSPVFNPIDRPFADVNADNMFKWNRVKEFEASRYKTTIVAEEDLIAIEERVNELKLQLEKPESEYEKRVLPVRIGKLTSGIARLNIFGASYGEIREKRDRAEDAWMAIRGAIKHGACPGGGWVLVRLSADLLALSKEMKLTFIQRLALFALSEALVEPVRTIYRNYGYLKEEIESQLAALLLNNEETYDVSEQMWVPKNDLLDSVPAVLEAIRNSLSIASLLGTVGGVIAFGRDPAEDAAEAASIRRWEQTVGERGSINAAV